VSAAALAEGVLDPELPHLTLGDLGIVRDVVVGDGCVEVVVTPTYTGCPATEVIRDEIVRALHEGGFDDVVVTTRLDPPWTTDWITPLGRTRLKAAGIAPPPTGLPFDVAVELNPGCPRCDSHRTRRRSDFGSTACKAVFVCDACHEPFEQIKPL
jgi:ring-1,2-phenylacetyl-CoA epoxidase subunit PaaD